MTPVSLATLPKRPGRRTRRFGRGHGSGRGTYAGRGIKGQRARSGGRRGMIRRSLTRMLSKLPKQRGFQSDRPKYTIVTLAFLETAFAPKAVVSPATLAGHGVKAVRTRGVKILGTGSLTKPLTVHAHAYSATAKKAILAAGGTATMLAQR
ncbi:MAG: 50S ribosomal protein L15 [Candidatus Kerfeldbacteria bacterium]|nr:50S ribosomal protein L15 [Candidatus Kerfeldbacteria bacterium]